MYSEPGAKVPAVLSIWSQSVSCVKYLVHMCRSVKYLVPKCHAASASVLDTLQGWKTFPRASSMLIKRPSAAYLRTQLYFTHYCACAGQIFAIYLTTVMLSRSWLWWWPLPASLCVASIASLSTVLELWPSARNSRGTRLHKFLSVLGVLIPNLSQLTAAERANPSFFTIPMESAVNLADCVPKGWWIKCRRGPASRPVYLERMKGEGLLCTVIERSIPLDFVQVAQLRVWCCYITVDPATPAP